MKLQNPIQLVYDFTILLHRLLVPLFFPYNEEQTGIENKSSCVL